MSACQIRRANMADAAALAALSIQVWLDTYAEGVDELLANYVLQEFTVENMHAQLQSQACWLAEQEGYVVGYLLLGKADVLNEHGAEVLRFYVQPRYQACGVGKALFGALLSEVKHFWLRVYHANQKAIGFYLHLGMRQIATSYFELGDQRHENYVLAFDGGKA